MRVVQALSTGAEDTSRFQGSSFGKTAHAPTLGPPAAVVPPVLAEPVPPVPQLAEQLPPVGALPPDGAFPAPALDPPTLVPPFETAPLPPPALPPAVPAPDIPAPATFPPEPALVSGSAVGRSEQPHARSATRAARQNVGIERF
jgi:hypothetical protein